jgi:putative transport protein
MNWLAPLLTNHVAYGMLVLCAVAALGLALGSLKVRGLGLGIAGTLFVGILFGHFGLNIEPDVRTFLQEFGLILFVYTIGIQVGPGFLTSLRNRGLTLNLLAGAVVVVGAATAVLLCRWLKIDLAAGVGIFAGATTNTPSLGAAQQALKSIGAPEARVAAPGLGYAVCYPFGILGIIIAMILVRYLARVNVPSEVAAFGEEQRAGRQAMETMSLVVENPNLAGLSVRQIPGREELQVVLSRIRRADRAEVETASPDTVLGLGDQVLAVGTPENLEKFRVIVGNRSGEDLMTLPGTVRHTRVVVTRREVLGRTVSELALDKVYGAVVARLTRADLEFSGTSDVRLQFGDMVHLVGTQAALDNASKALGNSVTQLNHTKLIPVFLGICLGVLFGGIPFALPGIPVPVRLGLAGGPLVIAIVLSRIGHIGPLLWYMPVNVNVLLREFGIVLFLACVGLRSGEQFVATLLQGQGFLWMAVGVVITLLPLLLVALVARRLLRLNYLNVCGLLAGSMTDPPALAFANTVTGSDAPNIAYATVYPLAMLMRIAVAQLMVLIFCR